MEKYGVVTSDKLNLRAKPASDAPILTQLAKNTLLDILGDAGFGWLQVQVDGATTGGYVSKLYITLTNDKTTPSSTSTPTPPPAAAATPTTTSTTAAPTGEKAQVKVATLNLRSTPGTDGTILAKLSQDTLLDVLNVQGDWLQVSANGQQGYVAAQYVTLILPGAASTTPSVSTPAASAPASTGTSSAPAVNVQSGYLISQPDLIAVNLVPTKLIPDQKDNSAALVARTWNSFGGLIGILSTRLNIAPDTIVGVLTAESGGRAFAADGRMIIRFENHIFYQYWGKANSAQYFQNFNFDQSAPANSWKGHQWRPDANSPWQTCHTSQDMEWTVLDFARKLEDTAALESISMGAPQIVGFNFRRLGYNNVQDMFSNFTRSAHAQLLAMFDFVRGPNTLTALQNRDYLTFAQAYNGPANATTYRDIIQRYANLYDQLIGSAQ
jgi:hypothetical protein